MLFVFQSGNKFIKVDGLGFRLTSSLQRASVWSSKATANSWVRAIKQKYPNAKIRKAISILSLIDEN
jgi:hypothetical protein